VRRAREGLRVTRCREGGHANNGHVTCVSPCATQEGETENG
jgi:hypothetical protein